MGFGGYAYRGGFDNGANFARRMALRYNEKPKKTVFETDMVAHVWNQQSQSWGHNAKASVYFEGDTIFSYGSHFPMARIDASGVCLFTWHRDSVTTNGHLDSVRNAVRNRKVIEVDNVLASNEAAHEANLAAFKNKFDKLMAGALNTRRSAWNRSNDLLVAISVAGCANEYKRVFFPRTRKAAIELPSNIDSLRNEIEHIGALKELAKIKLAIESAERLDTLRWQYRALIKAARKVRDTGATPHNVDAGRTLVLWRVARKGAMRLRDIPGNSGWNHWRENAVSTAQGCYGGADSQSPRQYEARSWRPHGYGALDAYIRKMWTSAEIDAAKAAREAQAIAWEAEQAEMRRKAALSQAEKIALWRAGEYKATLNHLPCMLRASGDEIVTSWGARFPVAHAKLAWRGIRELYAINGCYYNNGGLVYRLGHFQIDSVDSKGTIKAGCHTIERTEIERLAAELGLV